MQTTIRIGLHIVCFVLSLYALEGVDFARFFRRNRARQAQVLLILLSMALGYLVAQFLLMLQVYMI